MFPADPTGGALPWFDGTRLLGDGRRHRRAHEPHGRGSRRRKRVDFVDRDDDHPVDVLPPIGAPSWTRDGATLLVNSEYDVWALAVDGSGGTAAHDGARDGLVHRVAAVAPFGATPRGARGRSARSRCISSLFGKRTKQSGYARLLPSASVQRLVLADASIGGLAKADSADRYRVRAADVSRSRRTCSWPAPISRTPQRWTQTNPFQKDYAWGKAELMNFTSTIGTPLQAILYYPANYDPSKKYPMIVYTYEMLSQGAASLHRAARERLLQRERLHAERLLRAHAGHRVPSA